MDKNRRLRFLLEKYNNGSISSVEYEEFLSLLNSADTHEGLDSLLTAYWQQMGQEARVEKLTSSPEESVLFSGKRKRNLMNWRIAASVLILMASAIFYLGRPASGSYVDYKTGFGEVKHVDLPDGSTVTLNANTELSWDDQWRKKESRQVKLKGEAFFDIKNLNGLTFTVETGDVSVEVVGTSFNVDSRNRKTEVYLDEGKVKLHLNQERSDMIVMAPGEKVRYDAVEGNVMKTENESMFSAAPWKKGVLIFRDMEFREVLAKLGAVYGKTFICQEEGLLSKHIYLGVPYSDWQGVKEALELSLGIRISEWDDRCEISKK